jgi:hypothetical protein
VPNNANSIENKPGQIKEDVRKINIAHITIQIIISGYLNTTVYWVM